MLFLFLFFSIFIHVFGNCNKLLITGKYFWPHKVDYSFKGVISVTNKIVTLDNYIVINKTYDQNFGFRYNQLEIDGLEKYCIPKNGCSYPVNSSTYHFLFEFEYENTQITYITSYAFTGVIDNGVISFATGQMITNYNVFYGTQHVSNFPELKVQFSRKCENLTADVPISTEIPPMCEQIKNNIKLYKNGKRIVNAEYIINITPQEMKKQIVKISIPRNTTSKYIFNENQNEFIQKKLMGKFNKFLFKFVLIDGSKQIGFKVGKMIFRNMISMMEEGIPFSSENKCSTNDDMQLVDNEGNPTNLTGTSTFCCSSFSVWRDHGEL